jgi:hypothetical protein
MAHSLSTGQQTESVCHTEQCVKTGKSILDFVDLNVDPCSDFYQYTCKKWHFEQKIKYIKLKAYRWKLA